MSTAFHRGMVLLQQGRSDLADREFREALSEDPDDPMAHACLSLCLSRRDEDAAALAEADEAVRTGPDLAFCHYVRGLALNSLDRHAEAQAAALEAIRLDPDDADYPGLLASIEMGRRRWSEALAAADRGLALDPENATCMNFRAMALVQLGRKAEAAATLGSALADDPENALTHANQGWAYLHHGDHAKALEHFREALRLDPEMEWARVGIIEALKAKHPVYRLMLRFFLWMGRQSHWAQWVVILGFVFGRRILASIARDNPALAPFLMPVLFASFAFLMMTWISSPLFNLALRLNRFGRLALSPQQRLESSWIGGSFLLAAASLVAYLLNGSDASLMGTIFFGLMLLPLAMTFQQPAGTPRLPRAACTPRPSPSPGERSWSDGHARPPRPRLSAWAILDLAKVFVLGAMLLDPGSPAIVGSVRLEVGRARPHRARRPHSRPRPPAHRSSTLFARPSTSPGRPGGQPGGGEDRREGDAVIPEEHVPERPSERLLDDREDLSASWAWVSGRRGDVDAPGPGQGEPPRPPARSRARPPGVRRPAPPPSSGRR